MIHDSAGGKGRLRTLVRVDEAGMIVGRNKTECVLFRVVGSGRGVEACDNYGG